MKFDESKVYTVLDADELEPGDVVFAADTLTELKCLRPSNVWTIARILDESIAYRFGVLLKDNPYPEVPRFALAYIIAKHDDPYKEFKKAQAEGKEVWFKDAAGKWSSNIEMSGEWYFNESIDHYSLAKPIKDKVIWKDFKLFDKVEYDDIEQFVSAIDKRDTNCRIFLSYSGRIADNELKDIKRLEE